MVKFISKVIANCLTPLMHKLVAETQSSFIPGRLASDNMVVAQELIHTLRHATSRRGMMAVKVDVEKAYDQIEWNFIETTIKAVGSMLKFLPSLLLAFDQPPSLFYGMEVNFQPQRDLP